MENTSKSASSTAEKSSTSIDDSWEPVNTSEWISQNNPDKKDKSASSEKSDEVASSSKRTAKSEATSSSTKTSAKSSTEKKTKETTEKLKQQIEDHQAKQSEKQTEKTVAPISVDNTDAGIRLTIQNLQFKADSAELLPGEEKRLDQIAEILKLADGAQFLIEGHTASTGYEAGEMKLSKERADSVAAALTKRGIGSERFICKGSGGKKPIAPNNTTEGKALNRRVEITILD